MSRAQTALDGKNISFVIMEEVSQELHPAVPSLEELSR